MTLHLWPFQSAVHVGRTPTLRHLVFVFVWKSRGSWHNWTLRLA